MGYSEWERRQWLNSLLLWSYQNINNNNNEKKTFLSSLAWNRVAICLLAMWPKKPSRIYDEMEGKQASRHREDVLLNIKKLFAWFQRKKKKVQQTQTHFTYYNLTHSSVDSKTHFKSHENPAKEVSEREEKISEPNRT